MIVDTGDFKSFLPLLWMDFENGLATFEDSYRDGIRMEMQTALGTYLLSLSPDSQSYHWLLAQSK
ncbi:MAG: hypothetical protein J6V34_01125 [Oscillospiraceae bacterium]|nr:hypothetical protein [Oscillospiraceae bacterium]